MSSIADVIKKSIFGSVLSETVFYQDREIKAIVSIGTPVVRKNFFRGITVNDVVRDTIGKTVTFGASKNTKGFARGFEK